MRILTFPADRAFSNAANISRDMYCTVPITHSQQGQGTINWWISFYLDHKLHLSCYPYGMFS